MKHKTRGMVIVPILIGLAVAAVVWVAGYRGGGPKLANADGSPSALASMPLAASEPSDAPEKKPVEIAKETVRY